MNSFSARGEDCIDGLHLVQVLPCASICSLLKMLCPTLPQPLDLTVFLPPLLGCSLSLMDEA